MFINRIINKKFNGFRQDYDYLEIRIKEMTRFI